MAPALGTTEEHRASHRRHYSSFASSVCRMLSELLLAACHPPWWRRQRRRVAGGTPERRAGPPHPLFSLGRSCWLASPSSRFLLTSVRQSVQSLLLWHGYPTPRRSSKAEPCRASGRICARPTDDSRMGISRASRKPQIPARASDDRNFSLLADLARLHRPACCGARRVRPPNFADGRSEKDRPVTTSGTVLSRPH